MFENMNGLVLDNVSKSFGELPAVDSLIVQVRHLRLSWTQRRRKNHYPLNQELLKAIIDRFDKLF
jgi:hypothetical protein